MDPIQKPQQQKAAPITPSASAHGEPGKKVGPIIATLIIVLILIIAALYMFASRLNQQQALNGDGTMGLNDATTTQVQPVTNKSDDVNSIQADLNTSTKGLDAQNY